MIREGKHTVLDLGLTKRKPPGLVAGFNLGMAPT
jgi:hypothetical protein